MNFLKELQTRFFFICGGALAFVVYYKDTLNFNSPAISNNPTAISGLFVANILAFAFVFYFIAICAEFYFEYRKDSYLNYKFLMKKVIKQSNEAEASLIVQSLKDYSLDGGSISEVPVNNISEYQNFNNNGFIKARGPFMGKVDENGKVKSTTSGEHWNVTVNSSLVKFILENSKQLEFIKAKAK